MRIIQGFRDGLSARIWFLFAAHSLFKLFSFYLAFSQQTQQQEKITKQRANQVI